MSENEKIDNNRLLRNSLKMTLLIMFLTVGSMALTLFFKDKFELSKIFIIALSQFIVGVPVFYLIGKYSQKNQNKND